MVKTKKTKKEKKKKEKEESPVAVEKAKKGGKKKKKKSSGETFFPSDISFLKKCNFFCFFLKKGLHCWVIFAKLLRFHLILILFL